MSIDTRDERRCLLIVNQVMSSAEIHGMPAAIALALVKSLIIATSPNPQPPQLPRQEGTSP
jgi:hypothetical protein